MMSKIGMFGQLQKMMQERWIWYQGYHRWDPHSLDWWQDNLISQARNYSLNKDQDNRVRAELGKKISLDPPLAR